MTSQNINFSTIFDDIETSIATCGDMSGLDNLIAELDYLLSSNEKLKFYNGKTLEFVTRRAKKPELNFIAEEKMEKLRAVLPENVFGALVSLKNNKSS